MSEVELLRKIIRMLVRALEATPGRTARLGKEVMADPKLLGEIMALESMGVKVMGA